MAKRRKSAPQRSHSVPSSDYRPGFSRRVDPKPPGERGPRPVIVLGALLGVIAVLVAGAYFLGLLPGSGGAQSTPRPLRSPIGPVATLNPEGVHPPAATPMASPLAAPEGDGTRAIIEVPDGRIVLELYTESAPVASENFINLAEAGYYNGVSFHRIVPGFVIQGGDPEGTGSGGPGYTIPDEKVVGTYGRGILAMARSQAPNSQGSQFFIVLSDSEDTKRALSDVNTYVIFGKVVEGLDVVDTIAALPNDPNRGNQALVDYRMYSVTIVHPDEV
ncbi:MAG TPA: peptidylprolyl isomerase [Candidatus Limnocylindrales bacterium]|nr:peptidylprolyl isomerase [Candidatus Limnocylindrales bacterium]